MNLLEIFILTTLPAGISIIMLILTKKEVDSILIRHNANYTPKQNIHYVIKILKTYKNGAFLKKGDKTLLVLTMLWILVGYITIIIWVFLGLFFPGLVFGD